VKVSDLIGSRKEVYSITEDTSVHQAAQYLREKQVRAVGVVSAVGSSWGCFRIAMFRTKSPQRTNAPPG